MASHCYAYSICAAFLLSDVLGVDHVDDIVCNFENNISLGAYRHICAIELKHAGLRSLHSEFNSLVNIALGELDDLLLVEFKRLALCDRSEVLFYKRLEGLKVNISYNNECCTVNSVEELSVVLLDDCKVNLSQKFVRK